MADLKHTPCDCAEWKRLNEACADLMRERDQLKKLIAEKDANLGKRVCQYKRCIEFSELQAERDVLRKDAERYRWLRDNAAGKGYLLNVWQGYELGCAIDAAMQEFSNA